MTFKEAYEDDLKEAFFDLEELAEEHTIDGETVTVIVDAVELSDEEQNRKDRFNPKDMSLNAEKKVIYIRESDVKRKYAVNSTIFFDGKKMFVNGKKELKGVIQLTIGRSAV